MPSKPVISCPRCLRQYTIEPSVTLAQCGACKSHFQVAIAELAMPAEAAVLNSPITPHYNFLHEATAQAARNIKVLFDLAGEPFTAESVAKFMQWLPRSVRDLESDVWRGGFCNQLMARAHKDATNYIDWVKAHEAITLFLTYTHSRDHDALDMLIAAFAGVLSAEYELPWSKKLAIADEVNQARQVRRNWGWLSRWRCR